MKKVRMNNKIKVGLALVLLLGLGWLFNYVSKPAHGMPILLYHMVNDGKSSYAITPTEFEEQMKYLKEEGYTTISLLEYVKARKGKLNLPEKPLVISFDDGYLDNYTVALPIMKKYDFKGTVFVVGNDIGKKGYLNYEDIRSLQKHDFEIASHTANHLPLSKLSFEEKKHEIEISKLFLDWKTDKTVFFMAYPNGSYDQDCLDILKQTNYLGACTTDSGLNTFTTDLYELKRISIPKPMFGLTEFKLRFWRANAYARLNELFN